MRFEDSYSSAVRSSNLKSKPDTTRAATDVLGAAGLAGKKNPLAMALLRLFVGDNAAAGDIVEILATMAVGKAYRLECEVTQLEAADLGRAVLAWHRDGTCKVCSGHGFKKRENSPVLSEQRCGACKGAGKRPFDSQFSMERLELARWLLLEVERETAKAGPAAMAKLAPSLEL